MKRKLNLFLPLFIIVFILFLGYRAQPSYTAVDQTVNVSNLDCISSTAYLPINYKDLNYFETENNDGITLADEPIRSGIPFTGYHNDSDDYFRFHVEAAGIINVDLTPASNAGGVQLILFYQSEKNRVGFVHEAPYSISINGEAGTYYILVFTESGHDPSSLYTLEVEYPAPPIPSPLAPVPTCTPPPCQNFIVPKIFSQVEAVPETYPIEAESPVFKCNLDYGYYFKPLYSVKLIYEPESTSPKIGYWGIATVNGKNGFNAIQYGEICVRASAGVTNSSFTINLKEVEQDSGNSEPHEKSSRPYSLSPDEGWHDLCIPLDYYVGGVLSDDELIADIEIRAIENVNINFNGGMANSIIWVDEIWYRGDSCLNFIDLDKIFDEAIAANFYSFYSIKLRNFQCHSAKNHEDNYSVKLSYQSDDEFAGYFGIATKNESFDVSGFQKICLRASSGSPNQRFTINLQEVESEPGDPEKASRTFRLEKANESQTFCENLSHYADEISLDKLKSLNVQFNSSMGNSTILVEWIRFMD